MPQTKHTQVRDTSQGSQAVKNKQEMGPRQNAALERDKDFGFSTCSERRGQTGGGSTQGLPKSGLEALGDLGCLPRSCQKPYTTVTSCTNCCLHHHILGGSCASSLQAMVTFPFLCY